MPEVSPSFYFCTGNSSSCRTVRPPLESSTLHTSFVPSSDMENLSMSSTS
jgi:hypothetical protein